MKHEDIFISPKIGDTVVLASGTARNFKKGSKVKLLGFVDDDTSKLILEGVAPGGWVGADKVQRSVSPIRHKTLMELVIEEGNDDFLINQIFNMTSSLREIIVNGGALDKIVPARNSDNSYKDAIIYKDRVIPINYIAPLNSPKLPEIEYALGFHIDGNTIIEYNSTFEISNELKDKIKNAINSHRYRNNELSRSLWYFTFEKTFVLQFNIVEDKVTNTVSVSLGTDQICIYKGDDVVRSSRRNQILIVVGRKPSKRVPEGGITVPADFLAKGSPW